nr:MAG TPA: Interferon regulatory factor [Caudoviricetes sp.]
MVSKRVLSDVERAFYFCIGQKSDDRRQWSVVSRQRLITNH